MNICLLLGNRVVRQVNYVLACTPEAIFAECADLGRTWLAEHLRGPVHVQAERLPDGGVRVRYSDALGQPIAQDVLDRVMLQVDRVMDERLAGLGSRWIGHAA